MEFIRRPMNDVISDVRTWRVTIALFSPTVGRQETVDGVERMSFSSRLLPSVVAYPELVMALRGPEEWPNGRQEAPWGWEVRPLVADVVGVDEMVALQRVEACLDTVLDFLSFGLYAPVRVGQVETLDITPPVSVGDERMGCIWGSAPSGTATRGVDMGSINGTPFATLPRNIPIFDSRTAAALRWFNKALGTDFLHDKFMFMWIALEILCDLSDVSVEAPYTAKCGHVIAECPHCGKSTSREVRGQTIQKFLMEKFAVDRAITKKLWEMRQMMHGAIRFDSVKLAALPQLVEELRAAVVVGIKSAAGIPKDQHPFVSAQRGLFGFPGIGVIIGRAVTAYDIQPLIIRSER
jgi:hypothetical protein